MCRSWQAVLLVLCAWVVAGSTANIPFLFPAEQDTEGVVFNNVTGHLLPVESTFRDCLCLGVGEPLPEIPPDAVIGSLKPCGVFVLYTRKSSASFTLVHVDFDGKIVRQPQRAQTEVNLYGGRRVGANVRAITRKLILDKGGEEDTFTDGVNIYLSNLPLETSTELIVTTSEGLERIFYIYRKQRKLERRDVDIVLVENNRRSHILQFDVNFNDLFTPTRTPEQIEGLATCAEQLEQKLVMRPSDQAILFNPVVWTMDCPTVFPEDFSAEHLKEAVNVKGAENYTVTFALLPFDKEKLFRSSLLLNVTSYSDNVTISVNSEALSDFEGLVSLEDGVFDEIIQETFILQNASYYSQSEIETVEAIGPAMAIMAGVAVSTAVAASVGAGVAGSTASSVGSSATGGSMAKASNVLNEGQKVFLTGQLALAGLPELCEALASGLDWTMLNIQLPWEMEESEDPRVLLLRTVFWSFLILGCLTVFHLLLLGILLHMRIRIPSILRIPRLELYFGYWAVPAITTGSAALFKRGEDDTNQHHSENIGIGVAFLILFPGTFVVGHIWVMYYFFFKKSPEQYKAIMVLGDEEEEEEDDPMSESTSEGSMHAGTSQKKRRKKRNVKKCYKGCKNCWSCFWETFFWTPILGPPYDGEWIVPKGPKSVFFSRFGSMFDEFRGKPMAIREGTYQLDRQTSKLDRGIVSPAPPPKSIFVSRWEGSTIGAHLQVSGKILDIFKLAFIATMISGEEDPESIAQIIALLVLSALMLILLRIFRMPVARWDLGMAMLGEASDIVTFSIALAIMTRDMSRNESRIAGTAMLLTKLISFVASFLDTLLMVWELIVAVVCALKEKLFTPNPKLLDVIASLQKQNHGYLERKYFNRWVLKTLGKGIQAAPIKKGLAPFEELVYFKYIEPPKKPSRISVTEKPIRRRYSPRIGAAAGEGNRWNSETNIPHIFDIECPGNRISN